MMIVSSMISFFRASICLYVRLSLGFSGICNGISTSSIIKVIFCRRLDRRLVLLYLYIVAFVCVCSKCGA